MNTFYFLMQMMGLPGFQSGIKMNTKNSHCSFCGARFSEQTKWPRKCFVCYNESYSNPLPVVAAIIPIIDERLGVLLIQRNIEPHKGEWALPGGYMDNFETWQQSCAREVFEETGIKTDSNNYELINVQTSPSTGNLLVIGACTKPIKRSDVVFVPNSETLGLDVVFEPIPLAFPIHSNMLSKYLESK